MIEYNYNLKLFVYTTASGHVLRGDDMVTLIIEASMLNNLSTLYEDMGL
jgi:hypothetical protein